MEPFYKDELITLYNTDCLAAMRAMSNRFFDLAIVDPPYGIGNFVQTSGNVRGKRVFWNDSIPKIEYFSELRRVSKNRVIWGANYYNCFEEAHGAIIWIKNQPMPNFSKAEIASCTLHAKTEIYTQTWTNYVSAKATQHPCEKPVQLYKWLLKNYAKPGQTILDTHNGSGSINIACTDFGFNLTAFEIDEEYCQSATTRLKNHKLQQTLFSQTEEAAA